MRAYTRDMTPCYSAMMRAATRRIGAVYDEALAPFGINIAQYSLLRRIEALQPVSFTRLGHEQELDRSTVSRNARVLEKARLVAMGRGEEDQREAVVSLTPQGVAVLEAARPAWEVCQARTEARIGAAGLDLFRKILQSL